MRGEVSYLEVILGHITDQYRFFPRDEPPSSHIYSLALPMACFSYSKRQSVTSTGSRATRDEKQEHDRPCWSVGFETGIQSVREEV